MSLQCYYIKIYHLRNSGVDVVNKYIRDVFDSNGMEQLSEITNIRDSDIKNYDNVVIGYFGRSGVRGVYCDTTIYVDLYEAKVLEHEHSVGGVVDNIIKDVYKGV